MPKTVKAKKVAETAAVTASKVTGAKKKDTAAKPKISKAGLSVPVYDLTGKEKGSTELPKEIFSTEANPKLLAQYVRVYLANQRQGTASTKTRAEVIGSTKKIYRQKGTGNARHGSKKAPVFVGGGVVGGPRPRDYSLKLNSKQTKKALFGSLSLKLKEKNIFALNDEFLKMDPKTSTIFKFLKTLAIDKDKSLFVLPKMEKNNLLLSTRNIKNVTTVDAASLNPFEVLRNKRIFFLQEALKVMSTHFTKNEN